MNLPDRIKSVRQNLKQDEFALKLGVNKNTIGRWERGEQTPDAEELNRILEVYPDINSAWLLTGEGEMKLCEDFPFITDYHISPELTEIIDILQDEPPETEKFILQLLKSRKATREALKELGVGS